MSRCCMHEQMLCSCLAAGTCDQARCLCILQHLLLARCMHDRQHSSFPAQLACTTWLPQACSPAQTCSSLLTLHHTPHAAWLLPQAAHGPALERVRKLHGGMCPELATYVRLETLEGLVAWHMQELGTAKGSLDAALQRWQKLQVRRPSAVCLWCTEAAHDVMSRDWQGVLPMLCCAGAHVWHAGPVDCPLCPLCPLCAGDPQLTRLLPLMPSPPP
jgi:hypothetical protein